MKYFCTVCSRLLFLEENKSRLVDICGLMLKRSLARNRVPNNFLMMLHGRAHAGSALDEGGLLLLCEEVSVAAVQRLAAKSISKVCSSNLSLYSSASQKVTF